MTAAVRAWFTLFALLVGAACLYVGMSLMWGMLF